MYPAPSNGIAVSLSGENAITPLTSCSISGLVHSTLILFDMKSTASLEHASPHTQPANDFLPGRNSVFLSATKIFKF